MEIYYFEYEDIDDSDIKLEINLDLLRVKAFATTYNFNREIISKNKLVGWWSAKNKEKLFSKYEMVEPIKLKNVAGTLNYEKSVLKYKQDDKYGLIIVL